MGKIYKYWEDIGIYILIWEYINIYKYKYMEEIYRIIYINMKI